VVDHPAEGVGLRLVRGGIQKKRGACGNTRMRAVEDFLRETGLSEARTESMLKKRGGALGRGLTPAPKHKGKRSSALGAQLESQQILGEEIWNLC